MINLIQVQKFRFEKVNSKPFKIYNHFLLYFQIKSKQTIKSIKTRTVKNKQIRKIEELMLPPLSSVSSLFKQKKPSEQKISVNQNIANKLQTHQIKASCQYLYTPTQCLISNFLTTKKTVEDDLIKTLKSITEIRNNPKTDIIELQEHLSQKRRELQSIKRKLNRSFEEQTQVYDVMKKRIHRHQGQSTLGVKKNGVRNGKNHHDHQVCESSNIQSSSLIKQVQIEENQKDCLFNPNRLFELQMNKQIAYFMVGESVRMQEKLNLQEKLKKQLKIKQEQDKKKSLHPQQKASDIKQPKDNIQPSNQNTARQNQGLPFTFIEQIQSENMDSDVNIAEDIFDLERFFNMHDQLINQTLFNRQKKQPFSKNKSIQQIKTKKEEEKNHLLKLQYTKNDLFDQTKFVSAMQIETNSNDSHQANIQSMKANTSSKISSPFQGEVELQCMLYRKQHQISSDILSNQLHSISQFLYQNTHMVNKNQSDLQFQLTLCKAIQLIKTKNQSLQMQALDLIRNMISKLKTHLLSWQKAQLQKVTCMLLLPQQKIDLTPYLEKTQQSFKTVFQKIYKLPDFSRFLHTIYTGALVLKTPTCVEKDKQNPLICPLCNPLAEKVFTNIPLLTRHLSSLICRINGTVMDHENYPVMLPSYQIYSLKGLEDTKKTSKLNTGKVVEEYYCKFTQTWYNKELAKKVYLA